MAEVTLELIGAQLVRLLDGQRRIEQRLDDLTLRLQAVEHSAAETAVAIARIDRRLDLLDQRVARIERRLELVEA
jgi:hypothetical protein